MKPHFDWVNPFRLDDVYVGHLVFISRVPNIGIRLPKYGEFEAMNYKCTYNKRRIAQHEVKTEDCMKNLTELSIRGKSVKTEIKSPSGKIL